LGRIDGGPDPTFNSKLGIAIANAKRGQLGKPGIEAAIAKGQGKSISGAPLESVTVECMLPHGVAAIIEYLTESKLKVLQDVRLILSKNGGSATPTAFLFEKKGRVWLQEKEGLGEDEVLEEAIEAGATDVTTEDGKIVIDTAPSDATAVAEILKEKLKVQIEKTEIVFDPNEDTLVSLDEQQDADVQRIIDMIEEEPSLQELYLNATTA
jgi:transcriptional/translational regulatory protein YebC/TACO1